MGTLKKDTHRQEKDIKNIINHNNFFQRDPLKIEKKMQYSIKEILDLKYGILFFKNHFIFASFLSNYERTDFNSVRIDTLVVYKRSS